MLQHYFNKVKIYKNCRNVSTVINLFNLKKNPTQKRKTSSVFFKAYHKSSESTITEVLRLYFFNFGDYEPVQIHFLLWLFSRFNWDWSLKGCSPDVIGYSVEYQIVFLVLFKFVQLFLQLGYSCKIYEVILPPRQCCGSGFFYPGSDHFLIPDPDQNIFSSWILDPTWKVECKLSFFLLLML
jgi:hypothetical protein